jgi:predicted Zn-dependent peptidase
VSYVGTRTPADVAALLDAMESGAELAAGPEYVAERLVQPGKNRVLLVHKETNQALIMLIGPDGPFDPKQAPATIAYNEFMSGSMGSVVFQEVREARALAYAVGTNYRSPSRADEENVFTGQLGTQVDKTVEAIDVLLGLVRKMPDQPERLEQVRKSKDEQYRGQRFGFRQIAGVVQTWEDQGLAGDPRRYNWQTILNMTFDDLRGFAERFADMPMTITIVGDTSRIDRTKLAAFGEIEELTPDQLFNW